jgi:hypothetical protein
MNGKAKRSNCRCLTAGYAKTIQSNLAGMGDAAPHETFAKIRSVNGRKVSGFRIADWSSCFTDITWIPKSVCPSEPDCFQPGSGGPTPKKSILSLYKPELAALQSGTILRPRVYWESKSLRKYFDTW